MVTIFTEIIRESYNFMGVTKNVPKNYLAVEETGHSAADVARYLRIGRANVLRSIKGAKRSE